MDNKSFVKNVAIARGIVAEEPPAVHKDDSSVVDVALGYISRQADPTQRAPEARKADKAPQPAESPYRQTRFNF